jgi:hypothetical protein
MKLYPILFNEIAKSASDAFQENLVVILTNKGMFKKITLVNPSLFIKTIEKAKEKFDNLNTDNEVEKRAIKIFLRDEASKGSVIGNISYTQEGEDLYSISTSAAVDSYGPLIYQIVMYAIHPSWLMSDTALKPSSKFVWQKMYEYSNSGMYERKFLGEFNLSEPDFLLKRCSIDYSNLTDYREGIELGEIRATEEDFSRWLGRKNLNPEKFGFLWAYRKTSHEEKIKDLFENGDMFLEQVEKEFNIPIEEFKSIIIAAGSAFFVNLYDSETSYSE